MRQMSAERRQVVVMASSVAAMSGVGSMLFRWHHWAGVAWIGLQVAILVWVLVLFKRLTRKERGA